MAFDAFFLSAEYPITKRYELGPEGELIKHSYPFVYEVTSTKHSCRSLYDLYTAILEHAVQGDCLVKGQLGRALVRESRAGSTVSDQPTEWICLDLDSIEGFQSVDDFLDTIGAGGVDYILQWSSSMNVENTRGFRCHIFMQLDRPYRPQLLKNWLQHLNLNVPALSSQLQLTKTANALRWPLDITTCQNDKLLYISPPHFGPGILDPYPQPTDRISFVSRDERTLVLPSTPILQEALRDAQHLKISELRVAAGLPRFRNIKYKFEHGVEYMTNPSQAAITDIKTERGFVYFNLNGGDSWAYYHPVGNPDFIYNFKGEPAYRTQDLLPGYWAELTKQAASGAPDAEGFIYLAFREFSTGVYWNGMYDTVNDRLELHPAKSETQLRHFMKNHRMPMGETIPDWTRVFDPMSRDVIDREKHTVNIFNPSEYMKLKAVPSVLSPPPIIAKIIDHVLGSDPALVDHFYNWLAVILQYRTRTGTAWVLHGTEGTGKGLLMHSIITPLLGAENVAARRMEELESQFTEFMENKFVVFIDEIETGRSLYHSKITAKLKNLIVEPVISIRGMYRSAYLAPNYSSMIFASNKPGAVVITPEDRRFNVGVYQTKKLEITRKEIADIEKELKDFYAFLMTYDADPDRARTPLASQSRAELIDINRTAIDSVGDALLSGDLQALWDLLPSSKNSTPGSVFMQAKAQEYRDLLVKIVSEPLEHDRLTRDELYTILEYAVGGMPTSPNKFSALLKHHRLYIRTVWKYGRSVRGIDAVWRIDPEWHAQALKEIKEGSV